MYLIRNDDGSGQIADTERGILFPPQSVASIAARGYWEEVPEGSVDLAGILRLSGRSSRSDRCDGRWSMT